MGFPEIYSVSNTNCKDVLILDTKDINVPFIYVKYRNYEFENHSVVLVPRLLGIGTLHYWIHGKKKCKWKVMVYI